MYNMYDPIYLVFRPESWFWVPRWLIATRRTDHIVYFAFRCSIWAGTKGACVQSRDSRGSWRRGRVHISKFSTVTTLCPSPAWTPTPTAKQFTGSTGLMYAALPANVIVAAYIQLQYMRQRVAHLRSNRQSGTLLVQRYNNDSNCNANPKHD